MKCQVPYLLVLNKSEGIVDRTIFPADGIFISAKTGAGIDKLKAEILRHFSKDYAEYVLRVPYTQLAEYAKLKNLIEELSFCYKESYLEIKASIPKIYIRKFLAYCR